MASFSNTTLGSTPARVGLVPSETSQTVTDSRPLVTNSGAVFMKQPEMPAVPGWLPRWETFSLMSGVSSSARSWVRTSRFRSESPWAKAGVATPTVVSSRAAAAREESARMPGQRPDVRGVTQSGWLQVALALEQLVRARGDQRVVVSHQPRGQCLEVGDAGA